METEIPSIHSDKTNKLQWEERKDSESITHNEPHHKQPFKGKGILKANPNPNQKALPSESEVEKKKFEFQDDELNRISKTEQSENPKETAKKDVLKKIIKMMNSPDKQSSLDSKARSEPVGQTEEEVDDPTPVKAIIPPEQQRVATPPK